MLLLILVCKQSKKTVRHQDLKITFIKCQMSAKMLLQMKNRLFASGYPQWELCFCDRCNMQGKWQKKYHLPVDGHKGDFMILRLIKQKHRHRLKNLYI